MPRDRREYRRPEVGAQRRSDAKTVERSANETAAGTGASIRRRGMIRFALALALGPALAAPLAASDAESLAGKRVVFLGDSITQAGGYVAFATYYLERLYPEKDFDALGLGLASETLSGLSEGG